MTQRLNIVCLCTLLGLLVTTSVQAESKKAITGTWVVNDEATETLQNKVRKTNRSASGIGDRPVGIVLGVPIPTGDGSGTSGPSSTLKFPIVLECEEISFEVESEKVKASCTSGVSRDFLIGKLHGRTTRFRNNVLTESYSSTSRFVKHDIRVDKNGNLVAKVRIRPKNGASQIYVRVYSRPLDTESGESKTDTTESNDDIEEVSDNTE